MKKYYFLVLALVLSVGTSYALDANLSYATFKGMEGDNYVEIYLHVVGNSITFTEMPEKEGYQAAVEVTFMFKQGDNVVNFDKYTLKSPPTSYQKASSFALVDLKRMTLPNGDYTLKVILDDKNQEGNTKTYTANIKMNYDDTAAAISDIQFVEYFTPIEADLSSKYVKHGYFLKPYTYTIYPSFVKQLNFFAELYNTDQAIGDNYLVRFYIQEAQGSAEPVLGLAGFRKQEANDVNLVLMKMDISDLPTGDYRLVIEIRNRKNEIVQHKALQFRRSNFAQDYNISDYETAHIENTFVEDMSDDDLLLNLQSLAPRLDDSETPFLDQVIKKDRTHQQKFLLHYWMLQNELYPRDPYVIYRNEVDHVNEQFKTAFDNGYETDRGYVYLKYGPPTDIVSDDSDPNAPPYRMWVYYQLNENQRNVKFLFYNPSLAPENFVLLHSTMRGEVQDPQWKRKLYESLGPTSAQDAWEGTGVPSSMGSRAARLFDDY